MKHLLKTIPLTFILLFCAHAHAQSLSSLGLRLGGGFIGGDGAEINGRFGMGSGRIEGALAWSGGKDYSSLFLSGVYQIVKPLKNNFDYFYGMGLAVGLDSRSSSGFSGTSVTAGVPFQLGIEYNFTELPLNISLDVRPIVTLNRNGIFVPSSLGLGLRYLF